MKPTYLDKPTKLYRLNNISKHLDINLYIKREDQSKYLCCGGNKCRKLEYLLQEAKTTGCDTVITCGAVQSNHCMLTSSAAAKEGMERWIVLEQRIKGIYDDKATGNNFLYGLLGAKKKLVKKGALVTGMEELRSELEKDGKKCYVIPGGGSNPLGTKGYIDCAKEIVDYSRQTGVVFDYVFVTSGTGGTHIGLHLGFKLYGYGAKVVGISNNKPKKQLVDKLFTHMKATIQYWGYNMNVKREEIIVVDDYIGDGYSLPTEGMYKALQLFSQREGVLLDSVYTGKCADAMISMTKGAEFRGKNVLFVHTGGVPSLFHYKPYSGSASN